MYIVIAKSVYKSDNEIFKKHFAKNIGNDLLNEKVKVVLISLIKLLIKVENGYSRSCDKLRSHLSENTSEDVKQFFI